MGYTRIRGALSNLGYDIARGTIANILRENGIEPAPERSRKIKFLTTQWAMIAAADFFTVEVWTRVGLVRYLGFCHRPLKSTRAHRRNSPGTVRRLDDPDARNLTDNVDGFFRNKSFLIQDRDPLYTREFRKVLASAAVKAIRFASSFAQPKRVCRALRTHNKGILLPADDRLRGSWPASGAQPIRDPVW